MKIIFAKTRHKYDSYTDYWKLVELSGFATCYVDEIDIDAQVCYIVSPVNGEFASHMEKRRPFLERKARIVFWNLERPDTPHSAPIGKAVANTPDEILDYIDQMWVSDPDLVDGWRHKEGGVRKRYVTLGSHPGLCEKPRRAPQYDLCHMSYLTHRRSLVIDRLAQSVRIAPNAWGEARADILSSSKAMIIVHQFPGAIREPLRYALAAAYRLPIITEPIKNPWPFIGGVNVLMASYEVMVEAALALLPLQDLPSYGDRLYEELVVTRPFKQEVIVAVQASDEEGWR